MFSSDQNKNLKIIGNKNALQSPIIVGKINSITNKEIKESFRNSFLNYNPNNDGNEYFYNSSNKEINHSLSIEKKKKENSINKINEYYRTMSINNDAEPNTNNAVEGFKRLNNANSNNKEIHNDLIEANVNAIANKHKINTTKLDTHKYSSYSNTKKSVYSKNSLFENSLIQQKDNVNIVSNIFNIYDSVDILKNSLCKKCHDLLAYNSNLSDANKYITEDNKCKYGSLAICKCDVRNNNSKDTSSGKKKYYKRNTIKTHVNNKKLLLSFMSDKKNNNLSNDQFNDLNEERRENKSNKTRDNNINEGMITSKYNNKLPNDEMNWHKTDFRNNTIMIANIKNTNLLSPLKTSNTVSPELSNKKIKNYKVNNNITCFNKYNNSVKNSKNKNSLKGSKLLNHLNIIDTQGEIEYDYLNHVQKNDFREMVSRIDEIRDSNKSLSKRSNNKSKRSISKGNINKKSLNERRNINSQKKIAKIIMKRSSTNNNLSIDKSIVFDKNTYLDKAIINVSTKVKTLKDGNDDSNYIIKEKLPQISKNNKSIIKETTKLNEIILHKSIHSFICDNKHLLIQGDKWSSYNNKSIFNSGNFNLPLLNELQIKKVKVNNNIFSNNRSISVFCKKNINV